MIWFISCCFDLRNGKCYVELHNSVSAVCLFCPLCVFVLWFFVCLFVLCWAGVLCVGVCVYVSLCVCLFFFVFGWNGLARRAYYSQRASAMERGGLWRGRRCRGWHLSTFQELDLLTCVSVFLVLSTIWV